MDYNTFEQNIEKYLKQLKLELLDSQKKKLYKFMKLLLEKNNYMNLTAITDENEIILKHFIDSILIQKYVGEKDKVIDVGTGAGFPGIPLKIVKEENEILLLDSLNKRINFINEAIDELVLKEITAIHSRAEDAGVDIKYREKFEIATSRAVSRLNTLVEYMIPFVGIGGKCICLKGPNVEEELEEAKNAIEILGGRINNVEEFFLPESDIARTIIIIDKIKNTPKKYPRKAGMPNNKPL